MMIKKYIKIYYYYYKKYIKIYYNYYNTGRPATNENETNYVSAYNDQKNSPKYAFGYGLSYTQFDITNLQLSSSKLKSSNEVLKITVDVTNSGNYDGEEVVQLYIRDLVGSVVRPVKELKGFEKIFSRTFLHSNSPFDTFVSLMVIFSFVFSLGLVLVFRISLWK